MSFWDDITGGSPKQTSTLNAGQSQVSDQLAKYFGTLNPSTFNYNGPLTASITPGQQQIVNGASNFYPEAMQTYGQIGNYDPNQVNANFNQYVQQPAIQNWQNNIAPYLRESMPAFSSEQGNVLARSLLSEQNQLDQQRIGYQQQAQVNALNALSGAAGYNTQAMGIQSVPYEINQAGLSNQYQAFLNSNNQYQNATNQMLNYLGVQTNAMYQPTNPLATIASLGQAGVQGYSSYQNAQSNQQMAQAMQMMALAGGA